MNQGRWLEAEVDEDRQGGGQGKQGGGRAGMERDPRANYFDMILFFTI